MKNEVMFCFEGIDHINKKQLVHLLISQANLSNKEGKAALLDVCLMVATSEISRWMIVNDGKFNEEWLSALFEKIGDEIKRTITEYFEFKESVSSQGLSDEELESMSRILSFSKIQSIKRQGK